MKFGASVFLSAAFAALAFSYGEFSMASRSFREIRVYMSYNLPLDPSKIVTPVDYDLSYALASTLVNWSDSKDPLSGLADSWLYSSEKEIRFLLRPDLKWSDGESLTASDVVASLMRSKLMYETELNSLFSLIDSISAKSPREVVFKLKVPAAGSGIVKKLTEPMFGIVKIGATGKVNLSKSSGPFKVLSATQKELELELNPNWFAKQSGMADRVLIRQSIASGDLQSAFASDAWPNILNTSSLSKNKTHEKFEAAHFSFWSRNLDKAFFFSPGPRAVNETGRMLLRAINAKIDRSLLSGGLHGIVQGDQLFEPGYALHSPRFKKELNDPALPEVYRVKPLEILVIQSRIDDTLESNIGLAVTKLTGIKPKFRVVPLAKIGEARKLLDYDFIAAAIPMNDANLEGLLGYIFDQVPPFIPNAGLTSEKNYRQRIFDAKSVKDNASRLAKYRNVFESAVNEGCIVPLFHYSTVVVAKPGIDLSKVPQSDESVAFSKVRFQ